MSSFDPIKKFVCEQWVLCFILLVLLAIAVIGLLVSTIIGWVRGKGGAGIFSKMTRKYKNNKETPEDKESKLVPVNNFN